ncbi:MAG: extracellular solute-binding protein [Spirochaetaceae bacterium]|jgi:ABC-type glycerol-3-phosphate transport system substrate-binding protein|nr:extracellular solute-binding protein [Spirochaetaceae bacterium]
MLRFFILGAICLAFLGSCGFFEPNTAVLWTDRPEFAIYAEYFNSSQDQYKIETRYFPSVAQKLTDTREYPDIATGAWLKSTSTRTLFKPLDYFFKDSPGSRESFYPRLLALGRIDDKQYLFPVSFNLPALVFAREKSELLSNLFIIGLEEIKEAGKAYNAANNGIYSRMGFSPAWNDEFLFVTTSLFNTSFREASPLAWESDALERAVVYIQDWIRDANTSINVEDDFAFKYFYDPPSKLAISGRILFTYMKSSDFFTLAEEQRANLDFRWIAEHNTIPLSEDTIYYGVCKDGKAKKAANAFTRWFFREETQRLFLEASKNMRMNETLFGIGNGFSALRTVTEQVFPQFYPSLLGHMPPEAFLSPPNILPRNWMTLKERVILPYLHRRIRSSTRDETPPLEKQLIDWFRHNRGT